MTTERITLTIPCDSESRSYEIVIGSEILQRLPSFVDFEAYSRVLFIVDQSLTTLVTPLLTSLLNEKQQMISFACGEKLKNFAHLEKLLAEFQRFRLDRKSLVVNIGGGMLGDLAGFAASIYMRGIQFIQVPSTLLAQVDASVGGKVAINFSGIKNLIGSFHQPALVIVDVSLLKTLPRREFFSGFSEIIKHAIIFDASFMSTLERADPEMLSDEILISIIKHSCSIKTSVVEQDPLEVGLRKILNFGHTIGHAIESLSAERATPLLHGECVALGMLAEAAIAHRKNTLNANELNQIEKLLMKFLLPVRLTGDYSTELLIERMLSDKKNTSGEIFMALPNGLGRCQIKVAVSENEIAQALEVLYR